MRTIIRKFKKACPTAGDVEPVIAILLVLIVVGLVVSLVLFRKPQATAPDTVAPVKITTPTALDPNKTTTPTASDSEPVPVAQPTPEAQDRVKKAVEQGRAFAARGDFAEAVKCFEEAVNLLAPAKDEKLDAELAEARAELESRLHLLEASAAEERGDVASALHHAMAAQKARASDETNTLVARLQALLLVEEGRKKENAGELKEALNIYREAEKIHKSTELAERIAELDAIIKAREMAATKAKYDELVAKAKAAEKEEDFFAAVRYYEEARAYAAGREEEIETLLAAATRQREDYAVLFNMWLSRGNDHMNAGQWGKAIAAFEQAHKYNKTEPTIAARIKEAREKAILQDMVLIPAGEFLFGETGTIHYLKAFYIDRFEVTNEQYKSFVDATGHQPPRGWSRGTFPAGEENLPVTGVSWEDAVAYATWAGKRLPSEAEWEKAARGSDGRIFPWGNEFDAANCNSAERKIGRTVAVGTTAGDTSPYGIKDMAGNATEWTATLIEAGDDSKPRQAVLKGASFLLPGAQAGRVFTRRTDDTDLRMVGYGFRCVRDAE